jgi:hypothetical protein
MEPEFYSKRRNSAERMSLEIKRKEKPERMERPRGLEPPPTAWQAVVLPLYYGRILQGIL